MKTFTIFGLLFFLWQPVSTIAQQYEIRAVNADNGMIEVQMRETSGDSPTTSQYLTDLVLGLKWSTSYEVDLGIIDNTPGYNLVKSGGREVNGGFHFQAFGANPTLFLIPTSWVTNEWVKIMSIRNTLDGTISLGDFLITEVGFDVTTEPNIGINLSDYTPIINGEATGVALPLDFISFDAKVCKNAICLEWKTKNEQDVNHFEIEKQETTKNNKWVTVDSVTASNTSPATYSHLDQDVIAGGTYLYRIKSIDFDNSFQYSDIRLVSFSKGADLNIFPNPVNDLLNVSGSNGSSVVLSTMSGEQVQSSRLEEGIGQIDCSQLSSGIYILTVQNIFGDTVQSKRVIIE